MEHFDADPQVVLDTELNISEKLSHPRRFYDFCSTFENESSRFMRFIHGVHGVYFLSELILDLVRQNGRNRPPLSHQDSLDILLQTAEAMVYMHEQDVVHGDLTCLNIFVGEVFISSNATRYKVKVADFGSARSMIESKDIEPGAATINYAAPEVLMKRFDKNVVISHPKLIDVYSFGIIAFEVLTGVELYIDYHNDLEGKMKAIIDGTLRPPLRKECQRVNFLDDDRLLSLIERCWNEDPLNRPSFLEVVEVLNNVKVRLLEPRSGLHRRQDLVGHGRIGMFVLKYLLHGHLGIGSEPADINAQSARPEISFELQSRDLPSTRLLGKGLAGIGYETTWKGARYARKDFFGVQKDIFLKEAPRLVGLRDHKNIVKTYGWTTDKRSCSLVLEYMDDDLVSLLQKSRNSNKVLSKQSSTSPFDLPEALDMMVQIAAGVAYLHGEKLVHGDLKTKNILVSRKKGGELSSTVMKVADYGLVQTKRKSEFIVSRQVRKLDMVRWKAPECWRMQFMRKLNIEDKTSSESDSESSSSSASGVTFTPPVVDVVDDFAADVYSFAMICTHLLTGNTPYPHMKWKELGHKILDGLRPDLPDTICPELRGLLVSCWGESALRPSCAVVYYELALLKRSLPTVIARVGQGISFELQSRDLPSTRLLGKGLAGIGYETTWKEARYARKDFFGVRKDIFLKEAPRLVGLKDHKNVVKAYGWTTDKRSCSLVLEYMDDDLVSLLQKTRNSNTKSSSSTPKPPFDQPEALDMMVQIAAGVAYLHEEKLVHGDLKTKNILVSRKKGGALNSKVVKVTDYGLVQTKQKSEFIVSRQVRKLDMVRWKAPECWRMQFMRKLNIEDETSSESESESASEVSSTSPATITVNKFEADVYSFAMICSELLTGDAPYPHMKWKELGHKILNGLRPNLPNTCHPMLKDLLMSCWGGNPAKRPSFAIICSSLTLIQESIATAIGKQPQEVAMPFVARPLARDRVEMGGSTEESTAFSSSRMPSTSTKGLASAVSAIALPGPTSLKSLVFEAVEIIGDIIIISENVWVNKYQCKRVANRFRAIRDLLGMESSIKAGSNRHYSNLYCFASDALLTVLRKGRALLLNYVPMAAIKSLLTWDDNREAFREIHEELESMKANFPFDSFGDEFEIALWSQRARTLTHDADQDLFNIEFLPQYFPTEKLMEIERVVDMVVAKTKKWSGSLPSYLHIDAKILIKDYLRVKEQLVSYGGSVVCEGSWLSCDFALEVFGTAAFLRNKYQVLKRIGALMEIRHPHIIRFIGFTQGQETCAVLMELMPERDLRHYMKMQAPARGRPFTRSEELDIITQIAKGMFYLHTQGYVHGDLKCSKILVKKHKDYIEVKIDVLWYAQKLESAGGSSEFETVRRPRWSPPEALENYGGVEPTDELLKQADVYSFAMTCYEVLTGKLPFQDIREPDGLNDKIKAGERPELPADLHSQLKGLIESCWASDPYERPVFENICVILELIRSSMPAVTNKITMANVRNAVKQTPNALDLLRNLLKYPSTTTWNETTVHQSEQERGADGVMKLPECLNIKFQDLKIVRKVGKGASSTVYEAKWLGSTIAVKRINKLVNNASVSELQQELDFLIQLRHPYIIQLVGFSVDRIGRCLIVMEFMKGSLRELIDTRRFQKSSKPRRTSSTFNITLKLPFDEVEELSIITKLAQGMLYLHSKGVIHGDLKAPNVLCQDHGGSIDVKIVDFGVSHFIANEPGEVASRPGVGTGYWRAPEFIPRKTNWSRQVRVDRSAMDVYSFAMTCYEIVTGLYPFQREFGSELSHYGEVSEDVRPKLPHTLNAELRDLIIDCWQTDPARRPQFAEICTRLSKIGLHL